MTFKLVREHGTSGLEVIEGPTEASPILEHLSKTFHQSSVWHLGSVVTFKLEKLMCRRTPGWFGNPPVGVEAFHQYPNNLASRRAFAIFGIHRTQAIRWLGVPRGNLHVVGVLVDL
jgi:hypothetical protein